MKRAVREQLGDALVAGAVGVLINERDGDVEVFVRLVEGIYAKALSSCHGKISEGFVGAVRLTVVVGEYLDHLGEAIATAAFDLLGDFQMERGSRRCEQALIKGVSHQRVLERILARIDLGIDQIE